MTKREILLRYMNDLFTEITSFGKNCFQVQIGRGDLALHQVAFINVSLLGGDNEHLNYVWAQHQLVTEEIVAVA